MWECWELKERWGNEQLQTGKRQGGICTFVSTRFLSFPSFLVFLPVTVHFYTARLHVHPWQPQVAVIVRLFFLVLGCMRHRSCSLRLDALVGLLLLPLACKATHRSSQTNSHEPIPWARSSSNYGRMLPEYNCSTRGAMRGGCDVLARSCLRDRSVWILGTSVARQWLFTLIAMLKLSPDCIPFRQMQKEACGVSPKQSMRQRYKHRLCFGLCNCRGKAASTEVNFGWQTAFWDTNLIRQLNSTWARDPQTAPDVFILNSGYYTLLEQPDHWEWLQDLERGGPHLKSLVQDLSPKTRVYWLEYTPVTREFKFKGNPKIQNTTEPEQNTTEAPRVNYTSIINESIRVANAKMDKFWAGTRVKLLSGVHDHAMANLPAYDDGIHHSKLVPTFLKELLLDFCNMTTCSVEGYIGAKPYVFFH